MGATEDFSEARAGRGLLERDRELAALDAVIRAAIVGAGGAAVVTGPAGIGKTSLLREAETMAREAGATSLTARGSEIEVSFSYGVVKQLWEPFVRRLADGERAAAFAGAAELAGAVVDGGPRPSGPPPSADRGFAVTHALYWLCANLAERQPLVLVVDDLHWADPASLRWLAHLAPRLRELPVALVAGTRPALDVEARRLVEAVVFAEGTLEIAPGPLSVAAVTRLVGDAAGAEPSPTFAEACHTATGGNPFLCNTLLDALHDEGVSTGSEDAPRAISVATRAVATVVVRRLGRLTPAATDLARAMAVLGPDTPLRHLAALADLSELDAAAAADGLASQGILQDTRGLDFAHPLVRACIHDRIPPVRRRLLHTRAARLLHDQAVDASRAAAHLLLSEPAGEGWAVDVLEAAANRASAAGDPGSAVAHLSRALAEPPAIEARAVLLHRLGVAELQAGDPDAAADHLQQALDGERDPHRSAEVGHDLALALTTRGRYAAAVTVLEACADRLAHVDADRALGIEAELHQAAVMDPTQYRSVSLRMASLPSDPPGATAGERALLAALATEACVGSGPAATVRTLATRAFERGLLNDQSEYASLWGNAAFPLIFAEGYAAAAGPIGAAIDAATRRGSPIGLARAYGARAMLRMHQGDVLDAEADARVAVDIGLAAGYLVSLMPLSVLVDALVERDDPGAAEELLVEVGRSGDLGPGFLENWVLHSRGWLRLALDRPSDAIADFEELGRRGERGWHPWNPGMFAYRSGLALARWRLDDHAAAPAEATEEVALARRWGGHRALGIALRAAGRVDPGPDRVELLRSSADVLRDSGARLEYAKSLVALGIALRRKGQRTEASSVLHDGMDLAHRLGGGAAASTARQELVALGERPRRPARRGADALTASERRVAHLAAEGVANRDIAQSLYVTVRTVEVHLTNAYRKLAISGRAELRSALGDRDHRGPGRDGRPSTGGSPGPGRSAGS